MSAKSVLVPARRLREARERKDLGLRELARQLDISPSALSQIETGKAQPSLRTLYLLTRALGLSLDELFDRHDPSTASTSANADRAELNRRTGGGLGLRDTRSPLQTSRERPTLEIASGVQWDRLTSQPDPLVDFLYVTYAPGSTSTSTGALVCHAGCEYGFVLAGAIEATIGFETYRCQAGDSISFDSSEPHVLANREAEDATAIWVVVGRRRSAGRGVVFGPDATD